MSRQGTDGVREDLGYRDAAASFSVRRTVSLY